MTVSGTTPSTVAVTGVSGVATPGAISATQNFGYAISNGDVYSFPMSGTAIAATKVNGLPANGVISLSAGYAIDSSGESWDISTPSAPAQFLSDIALIPTTGVPMLFTSPDGSLSMAVILGCGRLGFRAEVPELLTKRR